VAEEKKTTRASEASFRRLDEGALAYGIRLHRLMEVADLRAKDVSFIADPRERALIARILALPLFADLKDAEIFREYAFCDEESGLHGSIDLLLAYPDREVIVDYKTKDLAEEAYPRQLAAYRRYVEKVFGKKARTFLLSLVEGTLKEIE
jgi:ATP-dependent exoDNAse (exonuclease V) beta subunit